MTNGFTKAMEFTLPWEVGRDRNGNLRKDGGLNYLDGEVTKWGIYQGANPDLDVANLTLEDAYAIYRERYWDVYQEKVPTLDLDAVPLPYAVAVFDSGVNCGINRCFNWHLYAVEDKDPVTFLLGLRRDHYYAIAENPKKAKYLNGWMARWVDLRKYCEILAS